MQHDIEQIERLRKTIEHVVGREIRHPKDFDFLSRQIEGYLGEHMSVSTLKRMWGYVTSTSDMSHYTVNMLSRMVGYSSWEEFCQGKKQEEENSHRLICRKLFTSALTRGEKLSIIWKPERKITIQFEGQDQFIVLESLNSKLKAGDIFHCLQFIEKQPLLLSGLYRKGMPPCDYICGRQGGIVWNLIEQKEAQ